ncbi:hypothetical protein FQZ97_880750 [compost metagenome]
MHEHRTLAKETLGLARQPGEGQVVVADHHALGEAGGTSGVEDAQQRIAATAHVLHRLRIGQQCLVGKHALGSLAVAGIDQVANGLGQVRDGFANLLEAVVDNEHGRLRIVEGVDDLRHAPAGVHRIQHPVRPGHAQAVFDIALRVARQHGDAVAALQAQALQCTGQACNPAAKLGEGQALAQITDGSRIGTLLHMAMQALGDVHRNLRSCCYGQYVGLNRLLCPGRTPWRFPARAGGPSRRPVDRHDRCR